jgi:hydrogenase maturation protease
MRLIIGYGNTLRGDDAAGRLAVEAIAERQYPGVKTLSVHQLMPELAAEIAEAECVVFIDASASGEPFQGMAPLTPAPSHAALTHYIDPCGLLMMASVLYRANPAAYIITIPAEDFRIGSPLSDISREGVLAAIETMDAFLHGLNGKGEARNARGQHYAERAGDRD